MGAWGLSRYFLEFDARFSLLTFAHKRKSQIIVSIGALGTDLQSFLRVGECFFKLISSQGKITKTIMRHFVPWIHSEGMRP